MVIRTEWASLTENTTRMKSGMIKKKAVLFAKIRGKHSRI